MWTCSNKSKSWAGSLIWTLEWHFQWSFVLGVWMWAAENQCRGSSSTAQQRSNWAAAVSLDKKRVVNFHGAHRTNPYHQELLICIIILSALCMFFRVVRLLSGRSIYFVICEMYCELQGDWILSELCGPTCGLIFTDQCLVLALKNPFDFQNRPSTPTTKPIFSQQCILLDKQCCKTEVALTNCGNPFHLSSVPMPK